MPCWRALDIPPRPSIQHPPQAAAGDFWANGGWCDACAAPLSPRLWLPRHRRVPTGALGRWLAHGALLRAGSEPPDAPPRPPQEGQAEGAERAHIGTFDTVGGLWAASGVLPWLWRCRAGTLCGPARRDGVDGAVEALCMADITDLGPKQLFWAILGCFGLF